MVTRTQILLILALALGLSARESARSQGLLYNQPSAAVPGGFAGWGGLTYDNFTLPTSADISSVSWEGFFGAIPTVHETGFLSGFLISFYADNAGRPGPSLFSANIPGTANETISPVTTQPTYRYSAALSGAFSAVGGNQYWISILASETALAPDWHWMSGTGGDGLIYAGLTPFHNDQTFALYTIPEPPSAPLLLLASSICIFAMKYRPVRQGRL